MSLWVRMAELGEKLKLFRPAASAAQMPLENMTVRSLSLKDLETEIHAENVRRLAEAPVELSVSFEQVFETARISTPTHGWTVTQLEHLLSTEPYNSLSADLLRAAVCDALAKAQVPAEDLVKDAAARDQTLDAYANFVCVKMRERAKTRTEQLLALRVKIKELEDEICATEELNRRDAELRRAWWAKKLAWEKKTANMIGCLLEHPVISVDEKPPDGWDVESAEGIGKASCEELREG